MANEYCAGGTAYAEGGSVDGDNEAVMDHCALEMMHALENKDVKGFMEAFHVLVADIMNKMQPEDEDESMGE